MLMILLQVISEELWYGGEIENVIVKSMLMGFEKYTILLVWVRKKAKMPSQNKHFWKLAQTETIFDYIQCRNCVDMQPYSG